MHGQLSDALPVVILRQPQERVLCRKGHSLQSERPAFAEGDSFMAGLSRIIDPHSHPIFPFWQGAPVGAAHKQPDWSVESALAKRDERCVARNRMLPRGGSPRIQPRQQTNAATRIPITAIDPIQRSLRLQNIASVIATDAYFPNDHTRQTMEKGHAHSRIWKPMTSRRASSPIRTRPTTRRGRRHATSPGA